MQFLKNIDTEKIKSLSTKFFYEKGKLCFQIILTYSEEKIIFFKNFSNYSDYQTNHNWIITAMNEKQKIASSLFQVSGGTLSYEA